MTTPPSRDIDYPLHEALDTTKYKTLLPHLTEHNLTWVSDVADATGKEHNEYRNVGEMETLSGTLLSRQRSQNPTQQLSANKAPLMRTSYSYPQSTK